MVYLLALLQIAFAYLLIDLLTGLYHMATDWGYNTPRMVKLFRDHHDTNTMEEVVDWQPSLAAAPALIASLIFPWVAPDIMAAFLPWQPFMVALSLFGVFAQTPHYFAHHPPQSGPIYWLQRWHVMIPPKHHADHHDGVFDRNFCIFSGLNNYWLDPLLALLSGGTPGGPRAAY